MARSRKTIDVEHVKQWVNEHLEYKSYHDMEKYGMLKVLDHILTETGNYKGYEYIDDYDKDNWTMTKDVRRRYL